MVPDEVEAALLGAQVRISNFYSLADSVFVSVVCKHLDIDDGVHGEWVDYLVQQNHFFEAIPGRLRLLEARDLEVVCCLFTASVIVWRV